MHKNHRLLIAWTQLKHVNDYINKESNQFLFICFILQLVCPYCCQIYKKKENLNFHLRGVHKVGPPLFCKHCNLDHFKSQASYYNHIRKCGKKDWYAMSTWKGVNPKTARAPSMWLLITYLNSATWDFHKIPVEMILMAFFLSL